MVSSTWAPGEQPMWAPCRLFIPVEKIISGSDSDLIQILIPDQSQDRSQVLAVPESEPESEPD